MERKAIEKERDRERKKDQAEKLAMFSKKPNHCSPEDNYINPRSIQIFWPKSQTLENVCM